MIDFGVDNIDFGLEPKKKESIKPYDKNDPYGMNGLAEGMTQDLTKTVNNFKEDIKVFKEDYHIIKKEVTSGINTIKFYANYQKVLKQFRNIQAFSNTVRAKRLNKISKWLVWLTYDYLGLGKKSNRENFDTNFLDMNSDYTGLGNLAGDLSRDTNKARKYVKREAHQYRKDVSDIRREAKEFKNDIQGGGWLGRYISNKRKESKAKGQLRNLRAFSDTLRSKRRWSTHSITLIHSRYHNPSSKGNIFSLSN